MMKLTYIVKTKNETRMSNGSSPEIPNTCPVPEGLLTIEVEGSDILVSARFGYDVASSASAILRLLGSFCR
jgi:hypothetical protein